MSTLSTAAMTAEEFFDFCTRSENRYRRFELERGKVVEMSRPGERHGVVCSNVVYILGAYVRQHRKGYVCANDTGVVLGRDPDTVRGPDVLLYEKSRSYDRLCVKYSDESPQLVVEVTSPNDTFGKVTRRISDFLQNGVPLVWLVDPEDRTLTAYRPGQFPQVHDENDEATGEPAFADLRVRVADLFYVPNE